LLVIIKNKNCWISIIASLKRNLINLVLIITGFSYQISLNPKFLPNFLKAHNSGSVEPRILDKKAHNFVSRPGPKSWKDSGNI